MAAIGVRKTPADRYVLDEGHHVFDARHSVLRLAHRAAARWPIATLLAGAEGSGRRRRAAGPWLRERVENLIAVDDQKGPVTRSWPRFEPSTGWPAPPWLAEPALLSATRPRGLAETSSPNAACVYARAPVMRPYSLEPINAAIRGVPEWAEEPCAKPLWRSHALRKLCTRPVCGGWMRIDRAGKRHRGGDRSRQQGPATSAERRWRVDRPVCDSINEPLGSLCGSWMGGRTDRWPRNSMQAVSATGFDRLLLRPPQAPSAHGMSSPRTLRPHRRCEADWRYRRARHGSIHSPTGDPVRSNSPFIAVQTKSFVVTTSAANDADQVPPHA